MSIPIPHQKARSCAFSSIKNPGYYFQKGTSFQYVAFTKISNFYEIKSKYLPKNQLKMSAVIITNRIAVEN